MTITAASKLIHRGLRAKSSRLLILRLAGLGFYLDVGAISLLGEKLCLSTSGPGPVDRKLKHHSKSNDCTVEGLSVTNAAILTEETSRPAWIDH
jgi:hypothetical protein